jgi:hypothetical protein
MEHSDMHSAILLIHYRLLSWVLLDPEDIFVHYYNFPNSFYITRFIFEKFQLSSLKSLFAMRDWFLINIFILFTESRVERF